MSHSSRIKIEKHPYQRLFMRPMKAAWGNWDVREGFLLKITDESGKPGYGEVAPLEAFGSESHDDAVRFLNSITCLTEHEALQNSISQAPPACAFGLWSAREDLLQEIIPPDSVRSAALMTIGPDWQNDLNRIRKNGFTTIKVKVGLNSPNDERQQMAMLLGSLMESEQVRIDPNRSWTPDNLDEWMNILSIQANKIEFIEEPILPGVMSNVEMAKLTEESPIPLALDESLSIDGIEPWLNLEWPGFWIVKPSIQGTPDWKSRLPKDKVIISSVFETGIGMNALVRLSAKFHSTAHGLGTGDYFDDHLSILPDNGTINTVCKDQLENIWNHFSKV